MGAGFGSSGRIMPVNPEAGAKGWYPHVEEKFPCVGDNTRILRIAVGATAGPRSGTWAGQGTRGGTPRPAPNRHVPVRLARIDASSDTRRADRARHPDARG